MSEEYRDFEAIDRIIHEPARLMIVAILAGVEELDFVYLLRQTDMSRGNLSSHIAKLEAAGYVRVEKTYREKIPMTLYRLTDDGHAALKQYQTAMKARLDKIPAPRAVKLAPEAV